MQSGVLYLKQRIRFGYVETVWGKTKKVLFLFYFILFLFFSIFYLSDFALFNIFIYDAINLFFFFAIKNFFCYKKNQIFFPILCTYILVLLTRKHQSTIIIKNKNYPLIHQQYYKYNQFYFILFYFFTIYCDNNIDSQ